MTTLHCHSVEREGQQNQIPVDDTITLDSTDRHRRRLALQSDNGIAFLLDLNSATLLRDGDVLRLSDQRAIKVISKPETLYAVRGRDSDHLLHLTWHVGNRHLPTQIMGDHILIRQDPVIRNMLLELGGIVDECVVGFDPVGGAYDTVTGSSHHAHSHDEQLAHHHTHG